MCKKNKISDEEENNNNTFPKPINLIFELLFIYVL